ncbi:hypothetical protein ACFSR2_18760 [Emticicia soli]|uniref:Uncharacterized protein n=1 Tax=Emticicia soli TaxID=2027878 RepID=A0ABW5JCY5_9BACT
MSAISFSNVIDRRQYDEREKRYLKKRKNLHQSDYALTQDSSSR